MASQLPTAMSLRAAAHSVAVFFVAALLATGCISLEQQGDRSFEAGKHKEAQGFYKQAIAEGSEDPDLYLKAARNELQLGNLASAERFYTQALKFGGGPDVAKELARYYVETSNYGSAVRVYQYLLYQVEDSQPVYNNLGTALLYAGRPFDAESYLLVAQQMDPKDPLPYLNLGLLYDQHLKQPWLAINFYGCFVELSRTVEQRRQATQRIRELEAQWSRLYDPTVVTCGETYTPAQDKPVENLADKVKVEGDTEPIDLNTTTEQTDKEPSSIIVERMVESLPTSAEGAPEEVDVNGATGSVPDQSVAVPSVEEGRKAFAKKDWQGTVDALTSVGLKDLEPRDLGFLGAAFFQLKKYDESAQWLEIVAARQPTADSVILLVDAQIRAGKLESAATTCDRFRGVAEMKTVEKHCENRMEDLKKAKEQSEGAKR